ncbi:MAG: GTP cyclohydrolase FolE2 [Treponemataceae bacterium]|nr:GTP cyclohydrolase FolE2 [Treponemataceae bacterium]
MRDIQNEKDTREIPLEKVGVKGLKYPVKVLDKLNKTQMTTGTVDLFVNLPHDFKGTHMSRFIEVFHAYHDDLSMKQFLTMLEDMCRRLDAQCAFGTMTFPFFVEKAAPVSGQKGMMCYECTYEGKVSAASSGSKGSTDPAALIPNTGSGREFAVSIAVPVTTLCPCSKAISRQGAHNQRGIVRIKVRSTGFFWIEDIIEAAEKSASSAVYSLLKREDEKFVTEQAYDNPRFVEDVVREVYSALKGFRTSEGNPLFCWFSVEAENFESIHNHNAYAYTEYRA